MRIRRPPLPVYDPPALTFMELHFEIEPGMSFPPDRLAELIEALPVGVFILNADGRAIYANSAAQNLVGRGIMDGDSVDNLNQRYGAYRAGTNELYPLEEMPVVRALAGERTVIEDMEVDRNGTRVALQVTGTPIVDDAGCVTMAVAVFQDITARRRAQQELAAANEHLEREVARRTAELANTVALLEQEIRTREEYEQVLLLSEAAATQASRAKSLFLMNVSHELRTPLNHIIGFSDLLTERLDDIKSRRLAETTGTSGRLLLDKVNDLIELARAEAEPNVGRQTSFDGDALLHSVAEQAGIRCDIPRPLGMLTGDHDSMRQILTDILGRVASQSVPPGFTISATAEHSDVGGRLLVRIPSERLTEHLEVLKTVFGEVPQGEDGRYRQHEVDFRLAVARAQARALGGDVAAGNGRGDDAAYVSLPLGTTGTAPDGGTHGKNQKSE
jgi:PAS domain S-box-containing protein